MAKTKEIKNYTIKVADGRFTFQITKKSVDGRYHSISLPYPFYDMVDGKNTKLTRKQTENYCVKHAQENGWLVFAADGNK